MGQRKGNPLYETSKYGGIGRSAEQAFGSSKACIKTDRRLPALYTLIVKAHNARGTRLALIDLSRTGLRQPLATNCGFDTHASEACRAWLRPWNALEGRLFLIEGSLKGG